VTFAPERTFYLELIDVGLVASRRVQATETTMQRTALTLLGALLISGLAVQLAAASEHHHRSKAYFGRYLPEYRGTYNQVDGPINVTPRVFDRFDPSVPHYGGPSAS
jgi:hypothetical protein